LAAFILAPCPPFYRPPERHDVSRETSGPRPIPAVLPDRDPATRFAQRRSRGHTPASPAPPAEVPTLRHRNVSGRAGEGSGGPAADQWAHRPISHSPAPGGSIPYVRKPDSASRQPDVVLLAPWWPVKAKSWPGRSLHGRRFSTRISQGARNASTSRTGSVGYALLPTNA